MKKFKKIMSLMLVFVMVIQFIPTSVSATSSMTRYVFTEATQYFFTEVNRTSYAITVIYDAEGERSFRVVADGETLEVVYVFENVLMVDTGIGYEILFLVDNTPSYEKPNMLSINVNTYLAFFRSPSSHYVNWQLSCGNSSVWATVRGYSHPDNIAESFRNAVIRIHGSATTWGHSNITTIARWIYLTYNIVDLFIPTPIVISAIQAFIWVMFPEMPTQVVNALISSAISMIFNEQEAIHAFESFQQIV